MASFVALATCFVAGSLAVDVPGCGCTLKDACASKSNPFCKLLRNSMGDTGYLAFGDPPKDTSMGICDAQEAEPLFQKRVGNQATDKSTGCPLSGSMRHDAGIVWMVLPVPCNDASINLTRCDFPVGVSPQPCSQTEFRSKPNSVTLVTGAGCDEMSSGWNHMSPKTCSQTEFPLGVLNETLKIAVGCKSWFGDGAADFVDEVVLQVSTSSPSATITRNGDTSGGTDFCKRGNQKLPLGMGWTAEHKQRRYKCYDVDHAAYVADIAAAAAPDFSILIFSVGNEPCKTSCRSTSASSKNSSTSLNFSSNGSVELSFAGRSNMWWLIAFIFNIWFVQA